MVLPLGLSMLWESVEPVAALEERFGFDGLDSVTGWVTRVLEQTWGIAVSGCSRVVISDHNAIVWVDGDRGGLVVKWSRARDRFASLDTSTRLLRSLGERGVPVATPVATTEGLDRVVLPGPSGELSVTVLPELAGDWLDVGDHAAVLAAGACLAQVHHALAASDDDASPPAPATGLRQRMDDWSDRWDRGLAPDATRRLRELLSELPDLDDRPQLVHNDFRAANILTQGSEVVGVLDLDDVVVEHRVHDLAKASVYLSTLFTDWGPTPAGVRRTFREGYESVRPLSSAEARWLDVLVLWLGIVAIPGGDDTAGWAAAV